MDYIIVRVGREALRPAKWRLRHFAGLLPEGIVSTPSPYRFSFSKQKR